jgi:hypothetical protein
MKNYKTAIYSEKYNTGEFYQVVAEVEKQDIDYIIDNYEVEEIDQGNEMIIFLKPRDFTEIVKYRRLKVEATSTVDLAESQKCLGKFAVPKILRVY